MCRFDRGSHERYQYLSQFGTASGPPQVRPSQQSNAAGAGALRTLRDNNRANLPSRTANWFALLRSAVSCGTQKERESDEEGVMKCASPGRTLFRISAASFKSRATQFPI